MPVTSGKHPDTSRFMRGDYRQNYVWDLVMLFANAVFNVFTGVFDVTNCVYVRQNIAVVFRDLTSDSQFVVNYVFSLNYSLLYEHIVLFHIVLCDSATILLFVFRIMFFQMRVFREISFIQTVHKLF